MKIDAHTHITLTVLDLKDIIISNLKAQGYIVKSEDIDFIVGGDTYDPTHLQSCNIIARKENK